MNGFLFKTLKDPGNQLEWLENILSDLEKVEGKAIIMSHIPNQNECDPGWGERYHALMERYQHIVRMNLYGHTHDE